MGAVSRTFDSEVSSLPFDVRTAFWYHGYTPWSDFDFFMKDEGDFLVRSVADHGGGNDVLAASVKCGSTVEHFMIHQNEQGFYFDAHIEPTIYKLILWHRKNRAPLTNTSKAVMIKSNRRPEWFYKHDSVKFIQKLGDGGYGEIYLADFTDTTKTDRKARVVVKNLREGFTREEYIRFNVEARLLKACTHRYIVRLYGAVIDELPLMLLLELCDFESLLDFLRQNASTTRRLTKLKFAKEAAEALSYIHSKGFIHRDIAARNCFFKFSGRVRQLKIGNFEMAHDQPIMQDNILHEHNVKWKAPESLLEGIYSAKSDVWSYGVLAWEIFSNGAEPYAGMDYKQAKEAILDDDQRLEMQEDCLRSVIELVYKCWQTDPNERPDMSTVHKLLLDPPGNFSESTTKFD